MLDETLALARLTLTNPKTAAAVVMRQNLNRAFLNEAMVLVAVLGVLLAGLSFTLAPAPQSDTVVTEMFANPLLAAVIQLALLYLSVLAVFLVGRAFGGTGSFDNTLKMMVWLQFLMVIVQGVELPLYLFAPGLAALFNFVSAIVAVWLTVNFVAFLHGFDSLMKVFAGMVATTLILTFLLTLSVGMLGLIAKGA